MLHNKSINQFMLDTIDIYNQLQLSEVRTGKDDCLSKTLIFSCFIFITSVHLLIHTNQKQHLPNGDFN